MATFSRCAVRVWRRFLDNMLLVLGEQRRDRISPAGLRILQAIESECMKVKDTSEKFQQKSKLHKAVMLATFGSIVVR